MDCICEYCHKESDGPDMPEGWDFIWQSYICGECLERARNDYGSGWVHWVKGGEYAQGKPDPRATPEWKRKRDELYGPPTPHPTGAEDER